MSRLRNHLGLPSPTRGRPHFVDDRHYYALSMSCWSRGNHNPPATIAAIFSLHVEERHVLAGRVYSNAGTKPASAIAISRTTLFGRTRGWERAEPTSGQARGDPTSAVAIAGRSSGLLTATVEEPHSIVARVLSGLAAMACLEEIVVSEMAAMKHNWQISTARHVQSYGGPCLRQSPSTGSPLRSSGRLSPTVGVGPTITGDPSGAGTPRKPAGQAYLERGVIFVI